MEAKPEFNYYPITSSSSTKEGTAEKPVANMPNVSDTETIKESGGSAKIPQNSFQSGNYIRDTAGWLLGSDGIIRAVGVVLSGAITAVTGTIGGWSISASAIYFDGATDALSAGLAPADYPFYAGKKFVDRATAPFKVEPSGKLTAADIVATGVINAQSGFLSAGVYVDTVNGILCESGGLNVGVAGHIRGGQTDYNTGTGFFLGYSSAAYKFSIGSDTSFLHWDGTDLEISGSIVNMRAGDTIWGSADTERFYSSTSPNKKRK
uniref:Uncharacterized protein n=1 Tax=uncultured marine virus TaxID=186617 RepID=A0A0F7L4R9_9VIRU|nr:hypothetical protein [uncultured marine virus]